jgi:glyoxylase-like metal-dependent hydrolase (beta-lactamase superfamily II)/rhodanese-related sulfurtransferase
MQMQTISVETLRAWLDEQRPVSILDVRPSVERSEWAIPGSMHVDAYEALNAHDPQALVSLTVPPDRPVVTVCGAGKTSQLAAALLAARGLEVYSLEGGMKAWSLAWNTAEMAVLGGAGRVIQVRRTGKGCLSYVIGVEEEAWVIDASLDPRVYLDVADQHGWQIRHVFDTHIHADHLSRSRSLAEKTGAMLSLPAQERVSFPFLAVRDGMNWQTGALRLTALHTPGHTPESTCYLLNNQLLFTGDTLFLTGVGRPDLHTTAEDARRRAEALYHSIRALLSLSPETVVLPGHTSTPIPFDDVPIASTLARIDAQVEVLHLTQTNFVYQLLARLPDAPPNYKRIVTLNEQGLLPDGSVTELEAGANRCAIS